MILERGTVASTQLEAKAAAAGGCAHGVVVVAAEQTAGRGRRGRDWLSGPHGLWMSMVLRIDLTMARASRLSLCACARIAEALTEAGADVHVKWPNDLLLPSTTTHPLLGPFRKAGGLLIEAVDVDDGRLRTAVLGLGLNLSVPAGGFPPDLAAAALGLAIDRLALARQLRVLLLGVAGDADDDDAFAAVRERLAARSATLGRRVRVEGVVGMAVGFGDDGALLIDGDDGTLHTVHAGDVMLA